MFSLCRNTKCWVFYLLSVTLLYVPFIPSRQGHQDLNLNVTWLDCHIQSQLYFQPWDEQGYLSYRHVLVFSLATIGGEALSSCGLLRCCCWCLLVGTIVCNTPARTSKLPLCFVSVYGLFLFFVFFCILHQAEGNNILELKDVEKRQILKVHCRQHCLFVIFVFRCWNAQNRIMICFSLYLT